MCLLEVVECAKEASLDAGHGPLREVGVVLGGGVWARPQHRHEAGCHHVRAELLGGGACGMGPLRFGGASLCWGRSVTFHSHRSAGIPRVRWVHLARQYIALPRPWLPLRMESSVSRDLRSHVPQRLGSSGSSTLVYVSRPGLCGGGGVFGGEEGIGAMHHPVASWCVVVGGGEGVVQIVHEGHVRGGGWLLVVRLGTSPGTWCRKLLREAIRATHVSRSHALVSLGVALVGGWAMSGSW